MAKIVNDKYYTPQHIVDLVIQRTKEIIGLDNITEFIEPSAGNGAFLNKLQELGKPVYAYDLYPEREDIKEQDYLKLDKEYVKGTCIIGNPPFGIKNTLSVKFYKKSITLADYIVFILPISQLNNNQQMYEFDLVYSEDLKLQNYTDKNIHCCLNIYKKNINGLNKKLIYKFKDVEVLEWRRTGTYKLPENYDYALCGFGSSIGKQIDFETQYVNEKYIIIHNKNYKEKIIEVLKKANWKQRFNMTASPALYQWQIYKYLKEQIPELQ